MLDRSLAVQYESILAILYVTYCPAQVSEFSTRPMRSYSRHLTCDQIPSNMVGLCTIVYDCKIDFDCQ